MKGSVFVETFMVFGILGIVVITLLNQILGLQDQIEERLNGLNYKHHELSCEGDFAKVLEGLKYDCMRVEESIELKE